MSYYCILPAASDLVSYLIVVFLLFLSIFPQYPPVLSPLWAECDDIAQTDSDMPAHTCILSLSLSHTYTHTHASMAIFTIC